MDRVFTAIERAALPKRTLQSEFISKSCDDFRLRKRPMRPIGTAAPVATTISFQSSR